MKLNRYDYSYNCESINRDFIVISIYRAKKNGTWAGSGTLLQALGEQFTALSVLYDHAAHAYLLFRRKSVPSETLLREQLASHPDLQSDTVKVCTVIQEKDFTKQDRVFFGFWVVSLLINALPALITGEDEPDAKRLHTLNGALYVWNTKSRASQLQIQAWQVRFAKDGTLGIFERTFKKVDERTLAYWQDKGGLDNHAVWQLDSHTGTLVRLMEPVQKALASGKRLYQKGRIASSKLHVKRSPFFVTDFGPAYDETRLGLLHKMEYWIDTFLRDWVELTIQNPQMTMMVLKNSHNKVDARIRKYFAAISQEPLRIVDTVGDNDSKDFINYLLQEWPRYCKALPQPEVTLHPSRTGANLIIVHEKDWYEQAEHKNQVDPYVSDKVIWTQHLTIETWLGREDKKKKPNAVDPVLRVCLKELCIKHDMKRQRALFLDWQRFGLKESYCFGSLHIPNRFNDTKSISLVELQPDGRMTTYSECTAESGLFPEEKEALFQSVAEGFKKAKDHLDYKNYQLEGFVQNQAGDINLIMRTETITLPDSELMAQTKQQLIRPFPSELQAPAAMAAWAQHLFEEDKSQSWNKALVAKLVSEIRNSPSLIDRKSLRGIFKNLQVRNNKERRLIEATLLSEYKIALQVSRGNTSKSSLLAFKMNLHWCNRTKNSLDYVVGYPNSFALQTTIARASHIRHVYAQPEQRLFFPELFGTFDDNAIRMEENTVLPVAFKYVRENELKGSAEMDVLED